MPDNSNQKIIEKWRGEPAPLLPVLHALHDRDGYLSDEALRAVSDGLKIPIAELFGTVTFYHHFRKDAMRRASAPDRSAASAADARCFRNSKTRARWPCPAPDGAMSRFP